MDATPTSAPPGTNRSGGYGAPISAPMSGNFPAVGSSLGPYFSVGRLGSGTFCSIHRCINLNYNHRKRSKMSNPREGVNKSSKKALRLVAAKVEIGDFKNSGVLGGEASILHFLDDVLPPQTVPTYMGHYVSTSRDSNNKNVASAIVMEYLKGQDMHKIREWSTRLQQKLKKQKEAQRQKIQQQDDEEPQFSPQQYSNDYNGNSNDNDRNSLERNFGKFGGRLSEQRPRRRIAVNDAVYLTAHVMLPLLRKMHSVGIIHRDVKPSNVVKRSNCSSNQFCVVDFGLSKSIVVPQTSEFANSKQRWRGSNWMGSSPPGSVFRPFELLSPSADKRLLGSSSKDKDSRALSNGDAASRASYRKERSTADFRGTSMYASVRVHQLQDYCPRDDIWSLMYVFCDLATGGLPWMLHAANKDRAACKIIKERIHGLEAQADGELTVDTRRLLMGDEYHRALFKKRNGKVDPPLDHEQDALIDDDEDPNLPQPLALSRDEHKVELLTRVFDHLKALQYYDIPDYDLVQRSLEGFLEKETADDNPATSTGTKIPLIDWNLLSEYFKDNESKTRKEKSDSVPKWWFLDHDECKDPLDPAIFSEAEASVVNGSSAEEENGAPLYGEAADLARLPLELRFRIAQMEYNTKHNTTIEPHLAVYDWLHVCFPLLYGPWNSQKYEKGGHRSNDDGYRREFFLKLLNKCLNCANKFGNFRSTNVIYDDDGSDVNGDMAKGAEGNDRPTKRRRRRRVQIKNMHTASTNGENSSVEGPPDLLAISKVLFELRITKQAEEKLSRAPPPRLSFGS